MLKIAIVKGVDGISAIRYQDEEGRYTEVPLSERSRSLGNKRAKAILEKRLSPIEFLKRNCKRRIAGYRHELKSPMANHPINRNSKTKFSDQTASKIALLEDKIEWLNKQTCDEVMDKRPS